MQYRTLGKTGMVVSNVALGTMGFGAETSEKEAFCILDAFIDAGGNLIDSSDVYNHGRSEGIIGRWMASRPSEVTDRVVLATKGRFGTGPDLNDVGLSRRHLGRALDASLKRLQIESVDLYQMHGWDPLTPVEETLAFLDDAVHAGKVRYVGLSNVTGWQLQLFVSTAKALGFSVPVTLQPQYSLLSREIEYEMVPAALHNNIGLLPWSPLAGGVLTGKYIRGGKAKPGTRAGSGNAIYEHNTEDFTSKDTTWRIISAVEEIAERIGATSAQVSLSWVINRPGVTAAIIGARNLTQLASNVMAADLVLSPKDMQALTSLSKPNPADYPYGRFGVLQRGRYIDSSAQPLDELSQ